VALVEGYLGDVHITLLLASGEGLAPLFKDTDSIIGMNLLEVGSETSSGLGPAKAARNRALPK
jgi:hypothetical protein